MEIVAPRGHQRGLCLTNPTLLFVLHEYPMHVEVNSEEHLIAMRFCYWKYCRPLWTMSAKQVFYPRDREFASIPSVISYLGGRLRSTNTITVEVEVASRFSGPDIFCCSSFWWCWNCSGIEMKENQIDFPRADPVDFFWTSLYSNRWRLSVEGRSSCS